MPDQGTDTPEGSRSTSDRPAGSGKPASGLSEAVNLRDIAEGSSAIRPGLVFRSSQLVRGEELQHLGLKAVLDLRESKRSCAKVEKADLRSEHPREDVKAKKLRGRLHARKLLAHGQERKPCRMCSPAFQQRYGVECVVYHADILPLNTKLSIFGAAPARTAARAVLRLCLCEHPQRTMAPAVADESQLGLSRFYPLLLDKSRRQIARALRFFVDPGNLPCLCFCIHGKDRTGLIIALLLMLLDIPVKTIKEDYARSEVELQNQKQAGNLQLDDDTLTNDQVLSSQQSAVASVAEHLQQCYGGVRSYCKQAGLSAQELDTIRGNILRNPG